MSQSRLHLGTELSACYEAGSQLHHIDHLVRQALVAQEDVELGRGGHFFKGFQLAQSHECGFSLEQVLPILGSGQSIRLG